MKFVDIFSYGVKNINCIYLYIFTYQYIHDIYFHTWSRHLYVCDAYLTCVFSAKSGGLETAASAGTTKTWMGGRTTTSALRVSVPGVARTTVPQHLTQDKKTRTMMQLVMHVITTLTTMVSPIVL